MVKARVVTIDGPAGAGKSTVACRLADRLGWRLLDTGAMYRAVTLAAIRRGGRPPERRGSRRSRESDHGPASARPGLARRRGRHLRDPRGRSHAGHSPCGGSAERSPSTRGVAAGLRRNRRQCRDRRTRPGHDRLSRRLPQVLPHRERSRTRPPPSRRVRLARRLDCLRGRPQGHARSRRPSRSPFYTLAGGNARRFRRVDVARGGDEGWSSLRPTAVDVAIGVLRTARRNSSYANFPLRSGRQSKRKRSGAENRSLSLTATMPCFE